MFGDGVKLLEQNDPQGALREFNESLTAATGDQKADSLYNIAVCHMRLGNIDAALDAVEQVIGVDPSLTLELRSDSDFSALATNERFKRAVRLLEDKADSTTDAHLAPRIAVAQATANLGPRQPEPIKETSTAAVNICARCKAASPCIRREFAVTVPTRAESYGGGSYFFEWRLWKFDAIDLCSRCETEFRRANRFHIFLIIASAVATIASVATAILVIAAIGEETWPTMLLLGTILFVIAVPLYVLNLVIVPMIHKRWRPYFESCGSVVIDRLVENGHSRASLKLHGETAGRGDMEIMWRKRWDELRRGKNPESD
jgi:hypothetical protein